jgi:tRNA threonylcarbamoyladenosine biosynthesis protein TsaE
LTRGSVVALRGGLAAGKTTLTKGIARGLSVSEDVTSPTYTIVSEYTGKLPLYHMDAYRLGGEEEFLSIGAEELLYGAGVCVVEWSERVDSCIPRSAVRIELEALDDGRRRIVVDASELEEALS